MQTLLFSVADTNEIRGRGIIIVSPVLRDLPVGLMNGQQIELRRPDGTTLLTMIRGIEMCDLNPNKRAGLLLPVEVKLTDVPVGTEVWTIE